MDWILKLAAVLIAISIVLSVFASTLIVTVMLARFM